MVWEDTSKDTPNDPEWYKWYRTTQQYKTDKKIYKLCIIAMGITLIASILSIIIFWEG